MVTVGDKLTITETATGSGYTWGKAGSNWVCLTYTNYNTVANQTTAPAKKEVVVTVTATDVNLRKGPGTNYGISGRVTKGNQLTITETATGSGYTWGKAGSNWVCLTYTNYNALINQPAPETVPTTTVAPETVPPTTAAPETTPSETTAPANREVIVTVTGTDVNLRKGPGTNYGVSGRVTKGDRLTIVETATGSGYSWGRAGSNWVCLTYTNYNQVVNQSAPSSEVVKTVNTSCLRIRSSASISASIVGYVYRGDRLTILETVQAGGTTWGRSYSGWVCMDYMI